MAPKNSWAELQKQQTEQYKAETERKRVEAQILLCKSNLCPKCVENIDALMKTSKAVKRVLASK